MNKKSPPGYFMKMAVSLAKRGEGKVNPNPMVGAVVVRDGKVVGKGFHRFFGAPHAEIEALSAAGRGSRGAEMFVTLEPCCHSGKTGPCTESIIEAGIKRVFVAAKDPNPLVNGKGIARLKRRGIDMHIGLCAEEAKNLNRMYYKYMRTGEIFVSLKMAITADGFIADRGGKSKWITSDISRRYVHKLRASHEAVLVGIDTARKDDPALNVRLKGRYRQPLRVVIDPFLRAKPRMRLFADDGGDAVIITTKGIRRPQSFQGVQNRPTIIEFPRQEVPVSEMIDALAGMGVTSLLVEGGAGVFSKFMGEGKVDRMFIFIAGKFFGKGLSPLSGIPGVDIDSPIPIRIEKVRRLKQDVLIEAVPMERRR